MPTLKKYSGIKGCEDFALRGPVIYVYSSSAEKQMQIRNIVATDNTVWSYAQRYAGSDSDAAKVNKYLSYLSVNTIKASADDYDSSDYNGTSTGICSFNRSTQSGGISYQIQFTATENATIKCFKFFKSLDLSSSYGGSLFSKECLMFAIYFDEPITVTAGQIKNMSINFAYDEEQVTII